MNFDHCSLCPKLCRHVCPVATATGREAATPTAIATVLAAYSKGWVSKDMANMAATLCIDCGACSEHCHSEIPLAEMLSTFRSSELPAEEVEPLGSIQGSHPVTLVQVDQRPVATALSAALGHKVSVLQTTDRLGLASLGTVGFEEHAGYINRLLKDRDVVCYDEGVAEILLAAGISWTWLSEMAFLSAPWFEAKHNFFKGGLWRYHRDELLQLVEWELSDSIPTVVKGAFLKELLSDLGHNVADSADLLMTREGVLT